MPATTLFDDLVIKSRMGKTWSIDCPKGLWGVTSENYSEAEQEARHYFWQYMEDGEYSDLITH